MLHPKVAFKETDISWETWEVRNYTEIELWNGLSELKTIVPTRLHGVFYAFFPQFIGHSPILETIHRCDDLLAEGRRVVAIGGSDAHALKMHMGPFRRVIFPYDFHFRTVNIHLFIAEPLTGDLPTDRKMIYEALAAGRCFIGYDLPASTRGFIFKARGREQTVIMGDEISSKGGVTLQAHLPRPAEIRLLKDGKIVQIWKNSQACAYSATEPGVYRSAWQAYNPRGEPFGDPFFIEVVVSVP